jgi:cyclic lactone autoinducer peptide
MTKTLKRENLMVLLLGGIALIATYIAQASSYACFIWTWEQPKLPKSLVKKD